MMPKGHKNLITVQPLGGFDQLLTYSLKEEFSSIIRIGSLVKILWVKERFWASYGLLILQKLFPKIRFDPFMK